LRIGVAQKSFDRIQGDDKELYSKALAALKTTGIHMTPVELPDESAGGILPFILSPEAATAFDDITRNGRVAELTDQAPNAWPNSFRSSRLIPAVEYIRAQRARRLLMEKMERFFEDWDVVVCPPYASLSSTNLTGHPQVVVPCGFVKDMPQGISFLGRLWDEGSPLRAAYAYQKVTDWHRRQPRLD
jgi:Asp-tRNA(Asn)/Glu-tRNA(Gln) amidotransferase A subunit family amidase